MKTRVEKLQDYLAAYFNTISLLNKIEEVDKSDKDTFHVSIDGSYSFSCYSEEIKFILRKQLGKTEKVLSEGNKFFEKLEAMGESVDGEA